MGGSSESTKPTSTVDKKIGDIKIQAQGYGNTIPWLVGTNRVPLTLFYTTNFVATPHTEVEAASASGGGKGGSKPQPSTKTTWTYSAAVMLGIAGSYITGTGKLWIDKKKLATIDKRKLLLFNGDSLQEPWAFLTSKRPTKAVNLRGFAYLARNNYPLTNNATLGNHSVEAKGLYISGPEGDANPADFIPDFLDGCGFDSGLLADLDDFRLFCLQNSFYFSPLLSEQRQASEILTEWLQLSNTAAVWSEGMLKLIPYKDEAVVFDLGYDDFIADVGAQPVAVTIKKQQDAFNNVKIEFVNRQNSYDIETAEAFDQANVEVYGLRTAPTITAHFICTQQIARNCAQHIMLRSLYVRRTYDFKLSITYIALEPMDVVTLTDPNLGLDAVAVRIVKIVLTADYLLEVTAEHFDGAVLESYTYTPADLILDNEDIPDQLVEPGDINPPVIFIAPDVLTATGYEVWMAISNDDPNYGGCEIYISIDEGASYTRIGWHNSVTRMGAVTSFAGGGYDPDPFGVITAQLTPLSAPLASVSDASRDLFETLCLVGHEFVAYKNATLTGVGLYELSDLRRNLYVDWVEVNNTGPANPFVRCDETLFKFPYNPIYRGNTIKLKFVAFNIYEDGLQDISLVPEYSFTLPGVNWDDNASQWDRGTTIWST